VFYMSTRRSYIWCLVAADLLSSLACGPKVVSKEARPVPEESACKPSHNNRKVDSEVLFFYEHSKYTEGNLRGEKYLGGITKET